MRTPTNGGSPARTVRAGVAAGMLALAGAAGAGNVAPYAESFEGYADGSLMITNAAGWSAGVSNAGVVSTDPVPIGALALYTNTAGHAFPLPGATHAKVLQMSDALTNGIATSTGGVVIVDLLTMPVPRDVPPDGDTNYQFACYFDTNNALAIWHYDASGPGNTWLSLTNSPTNELGAGVWCRLTVVQDYSNRLFQVAVNGHAPLSDAKGWTVGGGSQPGTWFRMVGTNNAYLSRFRHVGEQTDYLDDLVVTNRSLSASGMGFVESEANDGSIATTNTLTLWGDTFASASYATGTHFAVTGVPAGLSPTLSYLNPTQVLFSLSGQASPHTAAASTNAMTLTLLNPLFTLGRSADVAGSALTGLSVTFSNPPSISYDGAPFMEGASNGRIDNRVTITLTGDTFTNVSPLVAGTHYTTSGVPAGLTLVLTTNSATQLTATLTGQATSSGQNDSTNFNLTFFDKAFTHVGAANILGSSTNLDVKFVGSPQLDYQTNVFAEVPGNDGAVLGSTISIQGDLFSGTQNEDFVVSGKVQTNHVPVGLGVTMTLNAASNALAVAFTGHAVNHANSSDVTNLTFTFQYGAFLSTLDASTVSNYNRGDLVIDFHDQPTLTYVSGTAFTEAAGNDGTIANSLSIVLDGTTFAGTNGVFDGSKVAVSHVPAGLSAVVTKVDDTHVTVQLDGTAAPHRTSSDTSILSVHFSDTAFNTVQATNIIGAARDDLSVTFNDAAAVAYSTNRFAEASANDGSVAGSAAITLAGDTFAGTDGEVFGAGKVTFTNVPAGLTGVVTRTGATLATLTFEGVAASHAAMDSVTNVGLTFASAAFSGGNAAGVGGYQRGDLAIDFRDAPVLTHAPGAYAEAMLNDGSIGNTVVFSLTGDTFTNVAVLTEDVHYTKSGVPPGLVLELDVTSSTQVTARLTGNASPHGSGADSTIELAFLGAAFANVSTARIAGVSASLPVTFNNAPVLTYSGDTFRESLNGAIDNTQPITITLSSTTGEAFAGTNGSDFVAAGWVVPSGMESAIGLTAVVTRVSSTVLNVTLVGAAANNTSADNITGLTLTFQNAAFTVTQADQVQDYAKSNLNIQFLDATVYVNLVPYRESFESYTNGVALGAEQGWDPGNAAVVTTETAVVSALTNAFTQFPIATHHAQVLRMTAEVTDEIQSAAGGLVYADLMVYVMAREGAPVDSTNYQFAMYVDTNQQMVIWHQDTSGDPTNVWLTLTGGPTVTTGAWHRVTVAQDQANFRFQVHLDRSPYPVRDPAGYESATGTAHPGSWFNMVNHNGSLSRVRILGASVDVPLYVDDLVVDTRKPDFFLPPGSVFRFR